MREGGPLERGHRESPGVRAEGLQSKGTGGLQSKGRGSLERGRESPGMRAQGVGPWSEVRGEHQDQPQRSTNQQTPEALIKLP